MSMCVCENGGLGCTVCVAGLWLCMCMVCLVRLCVCVRWCDSRIIVSFTELIIFNPLL